MESEVNKLKAEVKRRAEEARLAEEEAAAAEAAEQEPPEPAEDTAAETKGSLPISGFENDLGAKNQTVEEEEQETSNQEVPDFLCPSSEEKSRQHEVRLWLRNTTYSNAPDFLPLFWGCFSWEIDDAANLKVKIKASQVWIMLPTEICNTLVQLYACRLCIA